MSKIWISIENSKLSKNGHFPDFGSITIGFPVKFWSRNCWIWRWVFSKIFTVFLGQRAPESARVLIVPLLTRQWRRRGGSCPRPCRPSPGRAPPPAVWSGTPSRRASSPGYRQPSAAGGTAESTPRRWPPSAAGTLSAGASAAAARQTAPPSAAATAPETADCWPLSAHR